MFFSRDSDIHFKVFHFGFENSHWSIMYSFPPFSLFDSFWSEIVDFQFLFIICWVIPTFKVLFIFGWRGAVRVRLILRKIKSIFATQHLFCNCFLVFQNIVTSSIKCFKSNQLIVHEACHVFFDWSVRFLIWHASQYFMTTVFNPFIS